MTYALAFPWAFLLLPLPWLVWKFAPPHREQSKAIRIPFFRQVTEAAGVEAKAGAAVLARRRVQIVVAVLAWGLLVLGLARPEQLGQLTTIEKAARDLVVAVDISGSMDAHDMKSDDGSPQQRLEVVKDVVGEFIEARAGDRVALIVFGTRAFVQTPFTEDLAVVRDLLDATTVGMAGPDTAIGDAIGLAIRTFEASEVEQRLMVLLSDGADTSSRMSPVNAAEIAADRGVRLFTVGVGDPKGRGDDRVDLQALDDIAQRTGGAFYYATGKEGLRDIYDEIERLNPRVTETLSFQPKRPLAWIAFGSAAALAVLTLLGLLGVGFRRAKA
ncbi:VWA domain-containing protein [Shimia sp. Alg240-R146]|uniref:VWA domain-containing protein n=1 Tax=Shimia sp. Alg240-R146 TaxID=2993449 RepID=UPI0022E5E2AB|nr:VWA domain-containing protein [Shimia sp. Alg240-R146]